MKIAFHTGDPSIPGDARFKALGEALRAGGVELYQATVTADIRPGTDMVLSIGGDGTFSALPAWWPRPASPSSV